MLAVVSPDSVAALRKALRAALDGSGPAVLPSDDPAPFDPDGPVAPGIAVVVPTSGSTGDPKGVELPAAALRASAEATHARLGGPGRWLLALPARHIAGIQVLVRSLLAGVEPVVMDLAGGFRPEAFVPAGARYTALVPTQLVRLLDGGGLAALRSFDAVLLGGAATPDSVLRRAREAGVRVVTTYGMTETAGGCVYDGVPLDGVGVRIADGLVELSGPTLARGYRNRAEETARAFANGWFRTGDLGRLRDGVLEVLGRADDLINTGGVKVAASAVERVLAACPGVVEVCVAGVPDPEWGQRVVAAVVGTVDVDDARAAVRAELGAAAVPREIRFVARLPVRGPGKVDRAAVAGLF
jgi:o-succinylbenzoate---CoA ligase